MHKRFVPAVVLLLGLVAAGANAQDTRQVGVAMGYPSSIGLIWRASDTVALRPEFSFSGGSTGSSSPGGYSSDTTAWGLGVSALFYARKWDKASAYLTPRFSYSHTSTTATQLLAGTPSTAENHGNAYSIAGSIGAQYSLSRRFGVFGEVGFAYTHQTSTYTAVENTANTWGTRTAIGVTLCLR